MNRREVEFFQKVHFWGLFWNFTLILWGGAQHARTPKNAFFWNFLFTNHFSSKNDELFVKKVFSKSRSKCVKNEVQKCDILYFWLIDWSIARKWKFSNVILNTFLQFWKKMSFTKVVGFCLKKWFVKKNFKINQKWPKKGWGHVEPPPHRNRVQTE